MKISVATLSAYGSAGLNTQIMMRVVCLEEELLDVPEYQGVPIEEWTTYLFHKEGQPLFRSHTCLRLMCEICPVRGYLGLQVQRLCAHSAWSLRSDGREHGGRGFEAGRTGLSAARMVKFRGIGTGEYHMRRPTTTKLLRKALHFAEIPHSWLCSRRNVWPTRLTSRKWLTT